MDAAGNQARRSFSLILDTTAPSIAASASGASFSPDGDGVADTTRLAWTANERATGTVRIRHGKTVVRSWTITNLSTWAATWNGRDTKGRRLADGRYELRIALTDAGGNTRTVSKTIVIDRTGGFLAWSRSFYPQDGDALAPTSILRWNLTRDAKTTLRLYDASGKLVRTVWTGRAQRAGARQWAWNGRLANGAFAPQGRYEARLSVTSSLGTVVLVRPVWASAFAVTPSATTVKPGPDAADRLHDDRDPAVEAGRHVQAAGQGGGLGDGDPPARRLVPRLVQGPDRVARRGQRADLGHGHRRRIEQDLDRHPGGFVTPRQRPYTQPT